MGMSICSAARLNPEIAMFVIPSKRERMTILDLWLSVAILGLVMILLVSSRVRIDLVGLIALALVGVFGLVPASSLFQGFSSYAAIILAEMFILGEALQGSGATDYMTRLFENIGKKGEASLVTALMAIPPVPSTFISDVGLMSIFCQP